MWVKGADGVAVSKELEGTEGDCPDEELEDEATPLWSEGLSWRIDEEDEEVCWEVCEDDTTGADGIKEPGDWTGWTDWKDGKTG